MTTILHNHNLRFTADIDGPDDGPAVLLLHGFPDTRHSFHKLVPALNTAGFRTIAPTIRGYEVSSQSLENDYHMSAVAGDVFAWLDELSIERAHLVGHDWGALIAYAAAARRPERFLSFTSLAIPGLRDYFCSLVTYPEQILKSWYILLFQLPFLAEHALKNDDYALINKLWDDWSPGWKYSADELETVKAAFRSPGVPGAAVSYYRALLDFLSAAGRDSYELLFGPVNVPTLALTGAKDGCLDTRMFDTMFEWENFPEGLRVERVDGAGHFLHRERPAVVNELIVEFLKSV